MGLKNKQDSQKPRNFWSGSFTVFLFASNLIVLSLLLNAQVDLNYIEGKYSAALDTISNKNEQITTYQTEIAELESKIDSQNSDIDSLKSKVSSLSTIKISRIDVKNERNINQYIFIDGRMVAGTRGGGTTYFYLPPGTYDFQTCNDPYKSNCSSKKSFTTNTSVFTWTLR